MGINQKKLKAMKNNKNFYIIFLMISTSIQVFAQFTRENMVYNNQSTIQEQKQKADGYLKAYLSDRMDRNIDSSKTDELIEGFERYQLIKEYENDLKATLLKNIVYNSNSRKILLLFHLSEAQKRQIESLSKDDSIEVRAKLGNKLAMQQLETQIFEMIEETPFKYDLFVKNIEHLMYIDNEWSHGVLEKLLCSDKIVLSNCDYSIYADGRKFERAICQIIIAVYTDEYLDLDIIMYSADKDKVVTEKMRNMVPNKAYIKRVEKTFKEKYKMKVKIRAPFFWGYITCEE